MEATTLMERLSTNTAEQHRADTKELQHEVELFTELPGVSQLLPSEEAKLFDQVFDELAQTIEDLAETESQTHPAAGAWKEFYSDYEKIDYYLRQAGSNPNEDERIENIYRAIKSLMNCRR